MSIDQRPEIENLLAEGRTYPPDPAFAAQANATADLYDEGGVVTAGLAVPPPEHGAEDAVRLYLRNIGRDRNLPEAVRSAAVRLHRVKSQ